MRSAREFAQKATVWLLVTLFVVQASAFAQTHVVAPQELQKQAASATRSRQQNMDTLNEFLSSPKAVGALQSAHMDAAQVKSAIPTLSDAELARLAARAEKGQADFAAGTLSNRDLLWIVVAIAALVLIIVAVR